MFPLDPHSDKSLVTQIVDGVKQRIESRQLRAGAKLPSIRQFAHTHHVSHFTVVDAYDRLVALGYLVPRQNAGFFVRGQLSEVLSSETMVVSDSGSNPNFDSYWLLYKVFQHLDFEIKPGVGWLPERWMDEDCLHRSLRSLAKLPSTHLSAYGYPKGNQNLRNRLSDWLEEHEITATPEQILLTVGASQALDLVARYIVHPGDTILVDEPGYPNLFFNLRLYGAKLVGVPRTPTGLDMNALENILLEHRPKAFFTNARLQNPTGTSLTIAAAHRVLQLAEKYDFLVVENDIYSELDPQAQQSLASMDQLSRVIYINSFSKTISPSLRVGFVAGHRDLIDELAPLKMVSVLTTSEINERLAYDILMQGRHRKHLKQLRDNLRKTHETVARRMENAGMVMFAEPGGGLFLWARHLEFNDSAVLAALAKEQNILLAPGHLFMTDMHHVPWMRLNVGHSLDDRLYAFLESAMVP